MPIRGPLIGPGLRLRIGASLLSAARAVDTGLVKKRLARFERQHRRYVEAQRKVVVIQRELHAAPARLAERDGVQDEAVETLARALVGDGHLRRNPFRSFGAPSPSKLSRLPFAEQAEAVHRLVRAVRRNPPLSGPTSRAVRAADTAARAVEEAIVRVASVEETARAARQTRDAMRRDWHAAYRALERGARAAADEGAPQLHAMLFARLPVARVSRVATP